MPLTVKEQPLIFKSIAGQKYCYSIGNVACSSTLGPTSDVASSMVPTTALLNAAHEVAAIRAHY
jgi:hypothetical protein